MTPKEKALELVNKFMSYADSNHYGIIASAKQCSLIAVNEILDMVKHTPIEFIETDYWQEVKQEIEKL